MNVRDIASPGKKILSEPPSILVFKVVGVGWQQYIYILYIIVGPVSEKHTVC